MTTLEDDLLFAIHHMRGAHTEDAFIELLHEESRYHHPREAVLDALRSACAAGALRTKAGRYQPGRVDVSDRLPTPEDVAEAVASLPDDAFIILAALVAHPGCCATKADLGQYGFRNEVNPWRSVKACHALVDERLVVETLRPGNLRDSAVTFMIPPGLQPALQSACEARERVDRPRRRSDLVGELSAACLLDESIARAFREVPQERFLPKHLWHLAYTGAALDVGRPQEQWRAAECVQDWGVYAGRVEHEPRQVGPTPQWTIAADEAALMLKLMRLTKGARVLMCGTSDGYMAALVAACVAPTGSVVIVDDRVEVRRRLRSQLSEGTQAAGHVVRIEQGDPSAGLPGHEFDCVYVDGSVPRIPRPLRKQVKNGGRLLCPVVHGDESPIVILDFQDGACRTTIQQGWHASPLRGEHGWGDIETLATSEALRCGVARLLRARRKTLDAVYAMTEQEASSEEWGWEAGVAILLSVADDADRFKGFALSLQSLGVEWLTEDLLAAHDKAQIAAAFEGRGIQVATHLDRIYRIKHQLGPTRRIRNFLAHRQGGELGRGLIPPRDARAKVEKDIKLRIGRRRPVSPVDYKRLQVALLADTADALDELGDILVELVDLQEST